MSPRFGSQAEALPEPRNQPAGKAASNGRFCRACGPQFGAEKRSHFLGPAIAGGQKPGPLCGPDFGPAESHPVRNPRPCFWVPRQVALLHRSAASFPDLPGQPRTVRHHSARAGFCAFSWPRSGAPMFGAKMAQLKGATPGVSSLGPRQTDSQPNRQARQTDGQNQRQTVNTERLSQSVCTPSRQTEQQKNSECRTFVALSAHTPPGQTDRQSDRQTVSAERASHSVSSPLAEQTNRQTDAQSSEQTMVVLRLPPPSPPAKQIDKQTEQRQTVSAKRLSHFVCQPCPPPTDRQSNADSERRVLVVLAPAPRPNRHTDRATD